MRRTRAGLQLLPIALVACSEAVSTEPALVRDSAGIRIVESVRPAWTEGEGWTVDSIPLLDLSSTGAGRDHEFFRVVAALRLDDGSIVVANAGTHQLRFYDSVGVFRSSVGREGEGPGEFQGISDLDRLPGDSLLVLDRWLTSKAVVLGPSGTLVRTQRLDLSLADLNVLPDGGWLAVIDPIEIPRVVRFDAAGALVDTIAVMEGLADLMPPLDMACFACSFPLIATMPDVVVAGDRVYLGSGRRMEFSRVTRDGTVDEKVRVPSLDRAFTEEDAERARERHLATWDSAPALRAMIDDLPLPELWPGYSTLLADSEGCVWASEYARRLDGEPATTLWRVFSPEGVWLREVTTPPRFRVLEIGSDWILGTAFDDFGVEAVQLLRLNRGAD